MRIGLNLLYLIPGRVGGTETYARNLIRALEALDEGNEYYVFLNRDARGIRLTATKRFHHIECPVSGGRRVVRYCWEQLGLPMQLRYYRIDVVHSLGYVGPVLTPCPHIVTIHDLNYVGHETMARHRRMALSFFVKQAARSADHVLTVSDFSKKEIMSHLRVPAHKISVTYEGGRSEYADATTVDRLGPSVGVVDRPYIVAFSNGLPHKNIHRLILAFSEIASITSHSLVLIGASSPELNSALQELAAIRDRVVFTGFLSEPEMRATLGGADLMVFPSLYEGFGLPVLEAQELGVPVAASTAGSLPEVAGDGAAYFDPYSTADMAGAIRKCLTDDAFSARLSEAGRQNVRRFSWRHTAERTLDVYERVAMTRFESDRAVVS